MSTQHTPAPWRIGDAGITVFGPPNGNPSPETVAATRNRANARLIAAAPDLLHALQLIDSNAAENPEWIRRVARDAIAKAGG
jgi:hypothetical protein